VRARRSPSPGTPTSGEREAVLQQLQLLLAVVPDLEEQEPDELADALGVAVDADVLAHDVLDGLDGRRERHGYEYNSV
jgi:hypothetical protein